MSFATPVEPASARDRSPAVAASTFCLSHSLFERLEAAVASTGRKASAHNEDAHTVPDARARLFVVADGVGGGAVGWLASRELVANLHALLDGNPVDAATLRAALMAADVAVRERIARVTDAPGAATVALCTRVDRTLGNWLVAWVGDCRIYRLSRRPGLAALLLTRDDTYGELNEHPPAGGSRDDPARMIGNGAVIAPNVDRVRLAAGEGLVLCSDGVHKHVDAELIAQVLGDGSSLERGCRELIALARLRGSSDDATVLVVRRVRRHLAARIALLAAVAVLALLAAYLLQAQSPRADGNTSATASLPGRQA